jgi:hypothetical protein
VRIWYWKDFESFLKLQGALDRKISRIPSGNIVGNDNEVYLHQISINPSREKESLPFLTPRNIRCKALKGLSALWWALDPMNNVVRLADGTLKTPSSRLGAPRLHLSQDPLPGSHDPRRSCESQLSFLFRPFISDE